MGSPRRQRRRDERGSFSLELAVIFPVVLLMIFAVIQAALYFHARNVALAAAQEGVRVARAENSSAGEGSGISRNFVRDAGGNDVLTGLGISARRGTTQAEVTVTGRSLSVIPGIPGFSVSQTAEGPVERFTDSGGS